MNKKDIALLVMVGGVSILISYFAFDALFKLDKPKDYQVVKVISDKIDEPRSDIFTETSINPTVKVTIGDEKIRDENNNQNQQGDNGESEQ